MEITLQDAQKVLETVDAGLVKGLGEPVLGQMCIEAAVCYALGLPHSDKPSCVDPVLRVFKIALNDTQWLSTQSRATGMRRLALAQLGSAGNFDSTYFVRRLVMLIINKIIPKALRIVAAKLPAACLEAIEDAALKCENVKDIENAAAQAANAADQAAYAAVQAANAVAAKAANAAAQAAYAATRAANAVAAQAAYAAEAVAANDAHANDEAAAYAANAVAAFAVAAANAADKELSSIAEDVVQILINMNAPGVQWLYLAPYEQA